VKKEASQSLQDMWVTLSALVHWIKQYNGFDTFGQVDDGERVERCWKLIGSAFLSMLNLLDRSKQLKPESSFKDLALIMALTLSFAEHWEDIEVTWDLNVIKYAQDSNINLVESGVSGVEKILAEKQNEVEELFEEEDTPPAGIDRWNFKGDFKNHEQDYVGASIAQGKGKMSKGLGGVAYDITKMPSAERKRNVFDKRDPLAGISAKDIKEGKLMIG